MWLKHRHRRWGLVALTAVLCACGGGGSGAPPARTSESPPIVTATTPSALNHAPQISGTPAAVATAGAVYSFTPTASDPDGTPLTFTIRNRPSWASFDATTGQLHGIPQSVGNFDNIEIAASDGQASASLPAFDIVVIAPRMNHPPVMFGPPLTYVEGGRLYDFTPSASDGDGDELTFIVQNRPAWAAFDAQSGRLFGTPAGTAGTFANIIITVDDGKSSASLPPFTINVTAPTANRSPVIGGIPETSALQGTQYAFQPIASDVDDDALTFAIANRPSWAEFDESTGLLRGTPGAAHIGTNRYVVISVTDGKQSVSLPAFAITVASSNTAPTISGTPAATAIAGAQYSFRPTATDPNPGTTLTFSIQNAPVWASFTASTGELRGTPGTAHLGVYSNIVISVSDGQDTVALPAFAISVTNTAPQISGTPGTNVVAGQPYSFTPIAIDPDGTPLTFAVSNRPPWASFDSATGQLEGTPLHADVGTFANIRLTVTDGVVTAALAPFSIVVLLSNSPPLISGQPPASVEAGTLYAFVPTASDSDDYPLHFSVANAPLWAAIDPLTGAFKGMPPEGTSGTYSNIVISVTDGKATAALPPFAITVTERTGNHAPTVGGAPATFVLQDTPYTFEVTAADLDGDAMTFAIANRPSWATFAQTGPATAVLQGTPGGIDVGTDHNIVISVSDGKASTLLAAFEITVISSNTPPTISGAPTTVVQVGAGWSFTPTANDADADWLTFSIINQPSWAQFDASTGALIGIPQEANAGVDANIVIAVSDGQDTAALPPFTITVNRPPVIYGDPPDVATVGSLYSFAATASDADLDELTFGIVRAPTWATFSSSGVLSGTPGLGDVGVFADILLGVTDGKSPPAVLPAFTITVPQPNRAPAISGMPLTVVPAGVAYEFTPMATDADLDELTFFADNKPVWATLDGTTGRFSGTPATAQAGTYSDIVVWVSDGEVATALAPFSITVTNTPPVIGGTPPMTATAGTAYWFTPTASDANPGTTLTFSINQTPLWAHFDRATGQLQGTPFFSDIGTTFSNIEIEVSDGVASASLAPFSITIDEPPNRAPWITGWPDANATIGRQYSFIPVAHDPDVADTLSFNIQHLPAWAMFDPASGRLDGMPGIGDIGTTSAIVITVRDNDDASGTLAAFSITVQSDATRTTLLTWEPPLYNTDGSVLTDLAGYRLYWGTSPDNYVSSITLSELGPASYRIENLTANTYYFAVTALNSAGAESDFSSPASVALE